MDPITLILAALAAGAAKGVGDTATEATRDAYTALRDLLRRKFKGDRAATDSLDRYTEQPDPEGGALGDHLRCAGAATDSEIVDAANRVLAAAKTDRETGHRMTVQGGQFGNFNTQTNTFLS
jgi:hypothetical protein